MQMRICYGEYHASADGGVTQLFYAQPDEDFSEERSYLCVVNEEEERVTLPLPDVLLYATEDEIRYWIMSLKNCKNQKHISQN